MAVKMRLIGGERGAKIAPENGGKGTTLARSTVPLVLLVPVAAAELLILIPATVFGQKSHQKTPSN